MALVAAASLVSAPLSSALADNQEDPIMALEEQWADALKANDMTTVASLMHKDFRLVRVYGEAPPLTKDAYLGLEGMSVRSTSLTPLSIAYSGNVATLVMDYTLDWSGPQGRLPPRFHIVDTWLKTDEGWKILQRVSAVKTEK
ncbi:MAG: nuclear transport factor 2 family protein [Pseudomonadota bacterium]